MTHRRLLLFKWLMVFIPPITIAVGYSLLTYRAGHSPLGHTVGLAETLLVTFLALVLAYILRRCCSGSYGDSRLRHWPQSRTS
jgi:ABC-type Fe3+ transport system permease subunit